jgi:hypothetical protein
VGDMRRGLVLASLHRCSQCNPCSSTGIGGLFSDRAPKVPPDVALSHRCGRPSGR